MKVLIVDDEPDIRRIAKLGLSRVGKMEVVEATNGTEALARAKGRSTRTRSCSTSMMPVLDGPLDPGPPARGSGPRPASRSCS